MANALANDPYLIIFIPSEFFPAECGQVPGECSQRLQEWWLATSRFKLQKTVTYIFGLILSVFL